MVGGVTAIVFCVSDREVLLPGGGFGVYIYIVCVCVCWFGCLCLYGV